MKTIRLYKEKKIGYAVIDSDIYFSDHRILINRYATDFFSLSNRYVFKGNLYSVGEIKINFMGVVGQVVNMIKV